MVLVHWEQMVTTICMVYLTLYSTYTVYIMCIHTWHLVIAGHHFLTTSPSPTNGWSYGSLLILNVLTLFQTIKLIFPQYKVRIHNARYESITWRHSAPGNIFISGWNFPRGSTSIIRMDNIALMPFNIYHDGLIVMQPLGVNSLVHIKQLL